MNERNVHPNCQHQETLRELVRSGIISDNQWQKALDDVLKRTAPTLMKDTNADPPKPDA
jgi:hypothetical protein